MKSPEPEQVTAAGFPTGLVGLALSVICLLLLGQLPQTPAGEGWYASPAFFPVVAIGLVVLGAVGQWWAGLRRRRQDTPAQDEPDDEIDASRTDPRLAVMAIVGLLVYQGLILVVGFAPATFLLVIGGARLCGLSRRVAWLFGLCLALVLYGVFVIVFKVGLPTPLLLEWVTGG
jgi:Tripartite tricarboxylate transporter TctB family